MAKSKYIHPEEKIDCFIYATFKGFGVKVVLKIYIYIVLKLILKLRHLELLKLSTHIYLWILTLLWRGKKCFLIVLLQHLNIFKNIYVKLGGLPVDNFSPNSIYLHCSILGKRSPFQRSFVSFLIKTAKQHCIDPELYFMYFIETQAKKLLKIIKKAEFRI